MSTTLGSAATAQRRAPVKTKKPTTIGQLWVSTAGRFFRRWFGGPIRNEWAPAYRCRCLTGRCPCCSIAARQCASQKKVFSY